MKPIQSPVQSAVPALAALALCSFASAQAPGWEDHPIGASWTVGGTTTSDGVGAEFECFQWAGGAWFCGGVSTVRSVDPGCNIGHRLELNNINVRLNFAGSIGPQTDLRLRFGEYGGNINIAVNGDFRNIANMIDIDGTVIGGCTVQVLSGGLGNDCGAVRFVGTVDKLVIGGQEFWIDGIPECEGGFESLPLNAVLALGATFIEAPFIGMVNELIHPTAGPLFGSVRVENGGLACGFGKELAVNNAAIRFFGAPGETFSEVEIRFGEYGGIVNLSVNDDLRIGNNFRDFHGLVIGGALVEVPVGGFGTDCGFIRITGSVTRFAVGGQELWIDCLNWTSAPAIPGDLNGDGVVNGQDLGAVLGAWGTATGDLNGDGQTNAADLSIVLANWS